MLKNIYLKYIRNTFIFRLLRFHVKLNTKRNKDKIERIFITGVGRGLGRLLTIHFAQNGYKVIGTDILPHHDLDEQVKSSLEKFYRFDLRNLMGIPVFVEKIIAENEKIDVLMNNAGILNFKLLDKYNTEEIVEMINVNLTSAIIITRYFLPAMIKQKFGRIILISSVSAFGGADKLGIYSPTKSGLMLFSDSLAKDFENNREGNITINSVNPDRINTPEYMKEIPGINLKGLISSSKIFSKILKIINSDVNGGVFSIFSFGKKWKYFLACSHRLFQT